AAEGGEARRPPDQRLVRHEALQDELFEEVRAPTILVYGEEVAVLAAEERGAGHLQLFAVGVIVEHLLAGERRQELGHAEAYEDRCAFATGIEDGAVTLWRKRKKLAIM